MSILEIWVLTHIYAVNEPYDRPSRAYNDAIHRFIGHGLITRDETSRSGFRITLRGERLAKAIQSRAGEAFYEMT